MTPEFGLDEDELKEAAEVIRRSPPGTYKLRKLYGDLWIMKRSPTTFGIRFRASVDSERLKGIIFRDTTKSNHNRYDVLPR